MALAAAGQIPIDPADPRALDRAARGAVHQGIVATVRAADAWTPAELVRQAEGSPLIIVLDGVEDPHNLGAILRTADAVGASGLVRQARHAAPLDGAVARTSAGAVAHVRIATVVNIARAVEELKAGNVWTMGLDEAADAAVRRRRFHAADGDRAGRRGDRAAPAGAGTLRFHGVDPDGGAGVEPERLGRGGDGPLRSGAPAAASAWVTSLVGAAEGRALLFPGCACQSPDTAARSSAGRRAQRRPNSARA